MWSKASYLTSLSLRLLVCKIKKIVHKVFVFFFLNSFVRAAIAKYCKVRVSSGDADYVAVQEARSLRSRVSSTASF